MHNLSTQEVVLSIENTPLVNMNGLVYQEYDNFFGKDIEINFDKADSFVKLENQTHLNRLKLSDTDLNLKKLKILFMNSKITNALNKKFNTELNICYTCAVIPICVSSIYINIYMLETFVSY